MWPDRVSNPGPPTYESGALPIALRGPAILLQTACLVVNTFTVGNIDALINCTPVDRAADVMPARA